MWNFGVSGIRGIIVRAGLSLGRKTDMEPFRVQLYRLTMGDPCTALHFEYRCLGYCASD